MHERVTQFRYFEKCEKFSIYRKRKQIFEKYGTLSIFRNVNF